MKLVNTRNPKRFVRYKNYFRPCRTFVALLLPPPAIEPRVLPGNSLKTVQNGVGVEAGEKLPSMEGEAKK